MAEQHFTEFTAPFLGLSDEDCRRSKDGYVAISLEFLRYDCQAARARGAGDAKAEEEHRLMQRIGRLMALAGSSNQHEAELAMQEAERLMLKFNIHTAEGPKKYSYRDIGPPVKRLTKYDSLRAQILREHFFVESIWTPTYFPLQGLRADALQICGTPLNLDVAEYVHEFLERAGLALWQRNKASFAGKGRRGYLTGLMMGFLRKLEAGRRACQQEGLVWTGDPGLQAYNNMHNPPSSWKYVGVRDVLRGAAYQQGLVDGKQIELHRPVKDTSEAAGTLSLI